MAQRGTPVIDRFSGMSSRVEGEQRRPKTAELLENSLIRTELLKNRPGQQLINTTNVSASGTPQGIFRMKLGTKKTIAAVGGTLKYDSGVNTWLTTGMPSGLDSSVARIAGMQIGDFGLFQDGVNDPQVTDGTNVATLAALTKPPGATVQRTSQISPLASTFNNIATGSTTSRTTEAVDGATFVSQAVNGTASAVLNNISATSFSLTGIGDMTSHFRAGSQIQIRDVSAGPLDITMFVASVTFSAPAGGTNTFVIYDASASIPTFGAGDILYSKDTGERIYWTDDDDVQPTGAKHATKITLTPDAAMDGTEYVDFVVKIADITSFPFAYRCRSVALLVYLPVLFDEGYLELRLSIGSSTLATTSAVSLHPVRRVKDPIYPNWYWVVFDFEELNSAASYPVANNYIWSFRLRTRARTEGAPKSDISTWVWQIMVLGAAPYAAAYEITRTRYRARSYATESPPLLIGIDQVKNAQGSFPVDENAGHFYKVVLADPSDSTIDRTTLYRQAGSEYFKVATQEAAGAVTIYDSERLIVSTQRPPHPLSSGPMRAKVIASWRTRVVLANVQEFNYEAGSGYTSYPLRLYVSEARGENNARLQFSRTPAEEAQFGERDQGFYLSLEPDAGSEIRQVVEIGDLGASSLIVFTDRKIFRVSGIDARNVVATKIADHGCQAPESVVVHGDVAWYLADDSFPRRIGVDGGSDATPIGEDIQPTILAASAADRRASWAVIKDLYYILKYDFTGGKAFAYDMVAGGWIQLSNVYGSHAVLANLADDDQEVYTLSSTRFARQFWSGTQDQADNATQANITSTVRTHWLDLGTGAEKIIQRLIATGDNGITVSATIEPQYESALAAISIPLTASGIVTNWKMAPITARGTAFRFTASWSGVAGKAMRKLEAVVGVRGRDWKK